MTSGRETTAERPELAVVIPALNERENLELLLPALNEVLAELAIVSEVVVVDGGSDGGTREAAERRGARVVQQETPGYGGALATGFAATSAHYIVTMDADLSHRPLFLLELWKRRHDADVLIASRYVAGGRAEMSGVRRLLSHILNRTYARALSLPIRDLSSGFRMYRREMLRGIRLLARDFDVLEEVLIRLHAAGWRIAEVPFHYMARGSGRSHVHLIRFGWAFAKTLVRMWQLRNSVESADYDYRAFDSPIWLQRYWQRTRHAIVLGYLEGRDGIVDVGCGSSRIILDLPRAVGVDILQNKLRWIRSRHQRLVRASGDRLPFRDRSVDTVITSEVLEHVTNPDEHLHEASRVLRPGGVLIAGTPDYDRWLWWVLEWIYRRVLPGAYAHEHVTHLTGAGLARQLEAEGFEILDCRYVGFCEMIFKARKVGRAAGRRG